MADRSEQFRVWLQDLTPEKIDMLVRLEKSARILIHVWNLVNEVDVKALHTMARTSHEIKTDYEK